MILAGGASSRMEGVNKALAAVGGRPIAARVAEALSEACGEVFVAANDVAAFLFLDLAVFSDPVPAACSLSGLHTALFYAKTPHVFVAPCDVPFLRPELIRSLIAETRETDDVVVPENALGLEPLCAVYSRRCLPAVTERLRAGRFKLSGFFGGVKVKKVPVARLVDADPGLVSFMNVNTPEDLDRANELAAATAGKESP